MRARTGTFILSCCVKQCVLLLHNPNRGLAGLALGLGINFFSKSDSILVIDNGSIGEISAHFRMLLIGFWNAVRPSIGLTVDDGANLLSFKIVLEDVLPGT